MIKKQLWIPCGCKLQLYFDKKCKKDKTMDDKFGHCEIWPRSNQSFSQLIRKHGYKTLGTSKFSNLMC